MPTPSHLQRTAALGIIDSATGLPSWAVGDNDSVRLAGGAAIKLYEELSNLEEAVQRTQANGELTAKGKDARIRQVATSFVKVDIALARGRRDALAREAQRAHGALMVPAPTGDKIVIALRAAEIRSRMQGVDQLRIDQAALVAAEAGDAEVLHALINAPGLKLVSEEGEQRATQAFFGAARSDEMGRAERLSSALRQLDGQISAAQSRAAQLGAEGVGPLHAAANTAA